MPTYEEIKAQLEEIRGGLEERLADIREEQKKLSAEAAEIQRYLGRDGGPAPRASAGRQRQPRGSRRRELLQAINQNPGQNASSYAKQMQIAPSQVYPLVTKLVEEGQIKKDGNALNPA